MSAKMLRRLLVLAALLAALGTATAAMAQVANEFEWSGPPSHSIVTTP
jgi:hypothetical protein